MAKHNDSSWFQQHWVWALPLGCMTPIVLLVAIFSLLAMGTVWKMKASTPYRLTMQELKESPAVIEVLGEPIKSGWDVDGTIYRKDGLGKAELTIPVKGSKAEGIVRMKAVSTDDEWELTALELDLGEDQTVVLIRELEVTQIADSSP